MGQRTMELVDFMVKECRFSFEHDYAFPDVSPPIPFRPLGRVTPD